MCVLMKVWLKTFLTVLMILLGMNLFSHNVSAQSDLVFSKEDIKLDGTSISLDDSIIEELTGDVTIIAEFYSSYDNDVQALIGISNSQEGKRDSYFSIFMRDNGELGFELRDSAENFNLLLARPASLYGKYKGVQAKNIIAFKTDKLNQKYSLYANGTKVLEEKVSNYKNISDIGGIDSINLGGVNREGVDDFQFFGEINKISIFSGALSDELLESKTSNNQVGNLIFESGDKTQANYFRIPAMLRLSNGRILASADARYGGTHDSYSNISIGSSYSDDGGISWSEPTLPLYFKDYSNQLVDWPRDNEGKELRIKGSASFIDSALVENLSTNTIFLLADFMPAGIGNGNADKQESGYKFINDQYYLKLQKEGDNDYHYTIRENGVIYDDRVNQPTEYSVDKSYNLKRENEYLKTPQYSVEIKDNKLYEKENGRLVEMNIFYGGSLFKLAPTNYIGYVTSNDYGETWSEPKLLPPFLGLNHNAPYLSPGQGKYLAEKDRIIFPTYTNGQMIYIFSDDNGMSWESSSTPLPFSNATSEAQIIELENGVIQTYFRTSVGKIGYMTSYDHGETWTETKYLDFVNNTNYGTQVAVINTDFTLDGNSVVIMSTPNSTSGRRNGHLYIGAVKGDSVNWLYEYQVDYPNFGYSYSALSQLDESNFGLYYEKYDSWSRNELHLENVLRFERYNFEQIINHSEGLYD